MANIYDNLRFAWDAGGSYKAGSMYSWYPSSTEAEFLASAFDVTRTGVATRVNKEGYIEEVAENVPRLDYSDGGCPKLLTEAASTNVINYSENFNNSYWSKSSGTSVNDGFTSPKGDANAYELRISSSNGRMFSGSETITSTWVTQSVFLKKGSGDGARLLIYNVTQASTDISYYIDDIESGEDYGNGWYRHYVSSNAHTSGDELQFWVYPAKDGSASTSYCYVFGVNAVNSRYLSSYIPTNGSAVTRGADQVYGAGNSSTFNSEAGVLFADVKALGGGNRIMSLSSGTFANRIQLNLNTQNNVVFQCSGQGVSVFPTDSDVDVFIQNKISFRWEDGNGEIWVNGVKKVVNTSFRSPASEFLQTLQLNQIGNTDVLQAKTKSTQHYNYLTDDEMEVLTGYTSYQDIANQFGFKQL